ncbi:MAG: hypothetical protein IKN33_05215, partial [Selenomonadaceae bacterium]|nr:hypothetical protein [Selenomonadaceae bacterium]
MQQSSRKLRLPYRVPIRHFSADYSQIELRLVADLSHDQTMLDAFAHGHDIHAITA